MPIKKIYFDMDGTVYDLYGVDGWEPMLKSGQAEVYAVGCPLIDMDALQLVCQELRSLGWSFGVLTWAARDSSKDFFRQTAQTKRAWVKKFMPYVTEMHVMAYGVPKQRRVPHGITAHEVYLVDDNDEVLKTWCGKTIDAKGDILFELRKILTQQRFPGYNFIW